MRHFRGNPPTDGRPLLVATIHPFTATGPDDSAPVWEVWLRGERCKEQKLAVKLVARGRAPQKANYWLEWHVGGRNIINRGTDNRLLRKNQPELAEALADALSEIQGTCRWVSDFLPALRETLERGGANPLRAVYEIEGANGPTASENGPVTGRNPLSVHTGVRNVTGPSSRQLSNKQKWTGEVCRKGHIAPRRKWDNGCMECRRLAVKEHRRRAKEKRLESSGEDLL